MIVLHFSAEVLVVCAHVHEAMSGQIEQYCLGFSAFLALQGFVNGGCDSVAGFRSRDYSLSLSEEYTCLE